MKYLTNYLIFESLEASKEYLDDIFLLIKNEISIKTTTLPNVGGGYVIFLNISLDKNVENNQKISDYSIPYKPVKQGEMLAYEISSAISRILNLPLFKVQRVEVHWINAGEWNLTSKKQGYGPGMLSKVFKPNGKVGPIEGTTDGFYSLDILNDFIEKKGDRLRLIKIQINYDH